MDFSSSGSWPTFDADGNPTGLRGDRYEFWIYRQVRKRLEIGELYLDDSLRHRRFSDELVAMDEKAEVLAQTWIFPGCANPWTLSWRPWPPNCMTLAVLRPRAAAGQAQTPRLRSGHTRH